MQNLFRINLGRMVLYLQPQELDELIEDTFYKRVNGTSEKAAVYTLHTIGTILENYGSYRGRDKAPEAYEQRKKVLLGYLMKGLVHFKESISIEALNIIGHELFGSENAGAGENVCLFFLYRKTSDECGGRAVQGCVVILQPGIGA